MNQEQGHKISANEVLNMNFEIIKIQGKSYTVEPPSIQTLARMIRCLNKFDIDDNMNIETLNRLSDSNMQSASFLTFAILGNQYNGIFGKLRYRHVYRNILKSNGKELKQALEQVHKLLGLEDFFGCAVLTWAAIKTTEHEETEH